MRYFENCSGRLHTIQPGDTLYNISKKYDVPIDAIYRANPYTDIYRLIIGERICIPTVWEVADNDINQLPLEPGPVIPPSETVPELEPGPVIIPNNPEGRPTKITYPFEIVGYVIHPDESMQDVLDFFRMNVDDFVSNNNLKRVMLQPGSMVRVRNTATMDDEKQE